MKALLPFLLACCLASLAAAAPARPPIVGLSHVALFVHDIEKSRAFYKTFLGFDEPFSLTNQGGTLHLTWIKINDHQTIELFPEKEAGSDRLNHISFETTDAPAMRDYLAAKNVKVPDKVGKGRIGNLNFNISDSDGHTVEIVQYAPDGWTLREQGNYLPDTRISTRMMHVGILVGNLEKALSFYGDIFAAKEFWRGAKSGNTLSWVNVKLPETADYVEFMLYPEFPPPPNAASNTISASKSPTLPKPRRSSISAPLALPIPARLKSPPA